MDKEIEELAKHLENELIASHMDWKHLAKHVMLNGGWKAPKNELVPLNVESVINTIIWTAGASKPEHLVEYRMIAERICSKFGSSVKRPINQHSLTQFLTGWGINQAHKLSVAICKEFSTAEVSEERIIAIIKNVLRASCTCNDGRGVICVGCFYAKPIATAIKRELENEK